MKLLFSSVLLATASMLSAATPQSAPPAPAAEPAPPSIERQQLARQYVQLTATADQFVDLFRAGMSKGISGKLDEVEDEESKARPGRRWRTSCRSPSRSCANASRT